MSPGVWLIVEGVGVLLMVVSLVAGIASFGWLFVGGTLLCTIGNAGFCYASCN